MTSYQVTDLVQEGIDFLAVKQPDVALAQNATNLSPDVMLFHLNKTGY